MHVNNLYPTNFFMSKRAILILNFYIRQKKLTLDHERKLN